MNNFKTVTNEKNELTKIIVAATEDAELLPVTKKVQAQSALRAAASFFRTKDYEHPNTDIGIHFYSKHNGPMKPYIERFGIVSLNYDGDLISRSMLEAEVANHPLGWAQLDFFNNRYQLTAIHPWGNPEKIEDEDARKAWHDSMRLAKQRGWKHDWVDILLQGYGLEIDCYFWQKYANVILEGIELEDDKEAEEHRYEGYNRRESRVKIFGTTNAAFKNEVTGAIEAAAVTMVTGEEVTIKELNFGRYTYYMGKTPRGTVKWDGSRVAQNGLMNIIDDGYRLKLEREF